MCRRTSACRHAGTHPPTHTYAGWAPGALSPHKSARAVTCVNVTCQMSNVHVQSSPQILESRNNTTTAPPIKQRNIKSSRGTDFPLLSCNLNTEAASQSVYVDPDSLTCNTMLPSLGGSEQLNDLEAPRSGCQEPDSQSAETRGTFSNSSFILHFFPCCF